MDRNKILRYYEETRDTESKCIVGNPYGIPDATWYSFVDKCVILMSQTEIFYHGCSTGEGDLLELADLICETREFVRRNDNAAKTLAKCLAVLINTFSRGIRADHAIVFGQRLRVSIRTVGEIARQAQVFREVF